MKRFLSLFLMIICCLCLASYGQATGLGVGTAAVSIDGTAGVTVGAYEGVQYSGVIGLHGSNLQGSVSTTNMQGIQMGTSAYGSIDITGISLGHFGEASGMGHFEADTGGSYVVGNACPGIVAATGSYCSHSSVSVQGSF